MVCRKVAVVFSVEFDVSKEGEAAVVVNVAFEVQYSLNIQSNPADGRDESKVDIVKAMGTETVAAIDVSLTFEFDGLLQLP